MCIPAPDFRIRCPDRGFFRQINGFVGLEMCLSFRNEQGKCRTFSRFALEGDRTVMEFHGVLDDMQTDSCLAGELRCVRSCNKRIEYMFLKFFGNTNSVVGYFDTAKGVLSISTCRICILTFPCFSVYFNEFDTRFRRAETIFSVSIQSIYGC